MSTWFEQDTPSGKRVDAIFSDVFKRAKVDFKYVVIPPARATRMLEAGKIDGEFHRIKEYAENIPEIIRVEEPLVSVVTSAFVINPDIQIKDANSLKNTYYRVEYLRGNVISERVLKTVVEPQRLSVNNSIEYSFEKLLRGRIDILVTTDIEMFHMLELEKYKNIKVFTAGQLAKVDLYTFLHKKHKDLATKMAKAIKEIKEEGLMQKYLEMKE